MLNQDNLGKAGVMYYDDNQLKIMPSKEVNVIDATGAGMSIAANKHQNRVEMLNCLDSIKF